MPLINLAAEHVATLPPDQKADVFEGIAIITHGLHPDLSRQALGAAHTLRDAEAHQLTFASLLRP